MRVNKGDMNLSRAHGLVKGFFPVVMSSAGVGIVKVRKKRGSSGRESTVEVVYSGSWDR